MLKLQNLKIGYKGHIDIPIADLELKQGEHCLLLGNSGSGKTTLLYTIAGFLKPISGKIFWGEQDINNLYETEIDKLRSHSIGMIHQTLHSVKPLSVMDNILLARYMAGLKQDSEIILKWLERLGLSQYANQKITSLSIGQQQRVAIIRAFINQPKWLLADEPTSALDDKACETVINFLFEIAKDTNTSLIISTHDARIKNYISNVIYLGEPK